MQESWPVRLFSKSFIKQNKYKKIINALGSTKGKHILEIGSDNGVFSYLFRQLGGTWKSADIDERSVAAMRELVKTDVYHLADGQPIPFADNEFDCVIIVDIIEHLYDDAGLIQEIYRVLKPGCPLIVNAPNNKENSLLMRFRYLIGITETDHGHVRPGYTYADLERLLGNHFSLDTYQTHTKFFSKLIDTLMIMAISVLKKKKKEVTSGRGILVTGSDMKSHKSLFRIYSLIYPLVWMISSLDHLLFFRSGYMFIATTHSIKQINNT